MTGSRLPARIPPWLEKLIAIPPSPAPTSELIDSSGQFAASRSFSGVRTATRTDPRQPVGRPAADGFHPQRRILGHTDVVPVAGRGVGTPPPSPCVENLPAPTAAASAI